MYSIDLSDCHNADEIRAKIMSDDTMDACLSHVIERICAGIEVQRPKDVYPFYMVCALHRPEDNSNYDTRERKTTSFVRISFDVFDPEVGVERSAPVEEVLARYYSKAIVDGHSYQYSPFAFFYVRNGFFNPREIKVNQVNDDPIAGEAVIISGITETQVEFGAILKFDRNHDNRMNNARVADRITSRMSRAGMKNHSSTLQAIVNGFITGKRITENAETKMGVRGPVVYVPEGYVPDDDGEGRDDLGAWTEGDLF